MRHITKQFLRNEGRGESKRHMEKGRKKDGLKKKRGGGGGGGRDGGENENDRIKPALSCIPISL